MVIVAERVPFVRVPTFVGERIQDEGSSESELYQNFQGRGARGRDAADGEHKGGSVAGDKT